MRSAKATDTVLNWDVLTSKRPGLSRDLPPGQEKWAWVANSSTLVYGDRDAILVDTFLITHGHGDHFFGLVPLLEHFPGAKALATPEIVKATHAQLSPESIDGFWRKRIPGEIPDRLVAPDALDQAELELEGHKLVVVNAGRTDTTYSTSLHVPSIGLIVAGDVVYNGIHLYLAETDTQSRLDWISALDKLEALNPKAVVAGHKLPENDDDPRNIAETRRYLLDFNRLDETTKTARDLYDAMLELHPNRANPGSLWSGANAAKKHS